MTNFKSEKIKQSKRKQKEKHLAHTERQTSSLSKDRPAFFRRIGIAVLSLAILIILVWQVNEILAPADIEIFSPTPDLIVQDQQLEIRGFVEPGSIMTLNGESLVADPSGEFVREIHLQPGLNTLIFEVKKRYGKIRTITRHVYVEIVDSEQ